jgi:hypothetical protein
MNDLERRLSKLEQATPPDEPFEIVPGMWMTHRELVQIMHDINGKNRGRPHRRKDADHDNESLEQRLALLEQAMRPAMPSRYAPWSPCKDARQRIEADYKAKDQRVIFVDTGIRGGAEHPA